LRERRHVKQEEDAKARIIEKINRAVRETALVFRHFVQW
jgi:hypothetical protein